MHFLKFRIFTLISIRFMKFRINTAISIYITRKLKILRVRISYHVRNCHRRKLFSYTKYRAKTCFLRKTFLHLTTLSGDVCPQTLVRIFMNNSSTCFSNTFLTTFLILRLKRQRQSLFSYDLYSLHKIFISYL